MSRPDDACARWIALSDREAIGDELTPDEAAFVASHGASCEACGAEANVWGELDALVDAPVVEERAPSPRQQPSRIVPRRRRSPWAVGALAGVAACAAVAASAVAWRARRTPAPPVAATSPAPSTSSAPPREEGVVLASTSGGVVEIDGRAGAVGGRLARGSVLFAREGGACVVVDESVRACVAKGTLLRVAELGAHRRLELLGGRIAAELDPQRPGTSFGVTTRDGAAIAIGTAFSVEVPPGDAPVVTRVLHGTVVVRSPGGAEQRVRAHEMTTMRAEAPRALPPIDEERDRALVPSAAAPRGEASPVRIEADAPDAVVSVDDRVVGPAPVAVLLTRGEHAIAVTAPSREIAHETLHVGAEPVARRYTLAAARPSASAAPPRATSTSLLVAARERRARGDVDGALAAYRELFDRYGASPEAHAALVPYGELLLARSDARGALDAFDRYVARGGPLEEEASFGRIRALRALGRAADERAATEAFVRRFPDGPLAASLRARLGSEP